MIFVDFPIYGPLRIPLLILEWIIAVISLELGIIFFMKYIKQPNQLRTSQELGFTSFCLCFSLMRFLLIIGDYFSSDIIVSPFLIWGSGSVRDLFLNFGYFSLLSGVFIFVFSIEKYKKYLFRKYFFTSCFFSLIILFLITFFFNLEVIRISLFIFGPLFLYFIALYLIDIFKKILNKENILIDLIKIFPEFLLLSIGFVFSTEYSVKLFGLEFRLFGSIVQLISFGLIFYFFIRLPSFSELDWQDKVEEILLLDKKSGLCAFYKSFINKDANITEVLMSGAITSVNIMLEELIPATDAKISVIEKKGKILNIFSSKFLTGVFISRDKLNSIIFYLKQFTEKVESLYQHVLVDWDGNIDIFYPVENIITELFSRK
ncbi:MAG: hypothetical protein HWN67_15120 [Candidatus Helarchaeota archaeon]|nr:hypothetical protein [Candidatus Helarchaeota archaeon]